MQRLVACLILTSPCRRERSSPSGRSVVPFMALSNTLGLFSMKGLRRPPFCLLTRVRLRPSRPRPASERVPAGQTYHRSSIPSLLCRMLLWLVNPILAPSYQRCTVYFELQSLCSRRPLELDLQLYRGIEERLSSSVRSTQGATQVF